MLLRSILGRPGSVLATLAVGAALALGACDLGKVTVNTASKVLVRAQSSLKMESDYELAARAIAP